MPTFVKPSGQEVEIHENSVSAAKALGWTEKTAAKKKVAKKKAKKEAE